MVDQLPRRHQFDADTLFNILVRGLALLLLIVFILLIGALIFRSGDSLDKFGLAFLWHKTWSPSTHTFGAFNIIIGTLTTALIAMIIAVPLSFGIAISITEWIPKPFSTILARLIELMAGIPSIIYGMWGLFTLVPFMATSVQPWLISHCQHIPVLNFIFGGLPIGIGVFTAGIVLALMVIPLISSMMRDILQSVPTPLREASYAIGATRWEVTCHILLPYTRAGMLGSVVLGFGRAIGETMAVTFVIGNSHQLFRGLFMPGTTISATIANEFTEAYGHLYQSSLIELGLILFGITFIVLAISRYLLSHATPRGGSQ